MVNIPKGTKDVLPSESYKWHYVENTAKRIADNYDFKEIRTPVFEHTELFLRGVGETTDIVNKEMYTFEDKGGRSITLKPEGTAGVARSFIENGLSNTALPLKSYYITPVFRYERPQAGRLREHHQFGIEFYGASNPSADAETILVADEIIKTLGLEVKLNINSMGCKTCRSSYNKALKEYFAPFIDDMCPSCKTRYEKNPLRMLDCKEEGCKKYTLNAPKITDFLCEECSSHFEKVKSYLDIAGLKYEVNPMIVRGLDYYTKTVFEFITVALGTQGTVCAGGRYDGLVEQLGGAPTCCVGFGMGLERVLMLMETMGVNIPEERKVDLYICTMNEKAYEQAFKVARLLRKNNVKTEIDHLGRSVKAQFKYADKIKARFVGTIGEEELENGQISLKDMENGTQEKVSFNCETLLEKIIK